MATPVDKRPGHSGQPVSKLGFDIATPIKIGHLRKQGEKGLKTFKTRFFVLYPNFLVYYKDAVDWESDKTYKALRVGLLISEYMYSVVVFVLHVRWWLYTLLHGTGAPHI